MVENAADADADAAAAVGSMFVDSTSGMIHAGAKLGDERGNKAMKAMTNSYGDGQSARTDDGTAMILRGADALMGSSGTIENRVRDFR